MEKVLSSDLPPAYCTLSAPDSIIAADSEHDAVPLVDNSFENKNVRVVFTQKVLSIFFLQILTVGLLLLICLLIEINIDSNFLWLVSVILYFASLHVMCYVDLHVENRKIYNYFVLVYYPLLVTFVIVTMPNLVYNTNSPWYRRWELLIMIFAAWVYYIASVLAVLFYSIFSFDSAHEFKLRYNMLVATGAFIVTCLGCSVPLALISRVNVFPTFYATLFLYAYFSYVLYDIDKMTGRSYRRAITPADYVTGAVNLQIDSLLILKNFIYRMCCSSNSDE